MKLFRIVIMLMSIATCAYAVDEVWLFDDPTQQALFDELKHEIRCPRCQNQNIADSNAVVAKDLQRKLYELVKQGQTKEQILSYMKQRYGDFVHYQPPVNGLTLWLWLAPILLVVFGAIFLFMRKPAKRETSQVEIEEVKKLLEKSE